MSEQVRRAVDSWLDCINRVANEDPVSGIVQMSNGETRHADDGLELMQHELVERAPRGLLLLTLGHVEVHDQDTGV